MSVVLRSLLKPGTHVLIVMKEHQLTSELTEGYVKEILTRAEKHPHGIKVKLETGEVGRVKQIIE